MTVYYPRIKKTADGNFILFYQEGEHGDTVYCTLSSDLKNWAEPIPLFEHESEKDIKYATCDAVVLDSGEILAVCSYRCADTYDINPHLNGIVMKKSSDNGKSWSEKKVIYVGTTWEPYPIQLSSGEIQVYFTNTTCYYRNEIGDASTGTAMVRSLDGGKSWSGDTGYPYSAEIVSQTATRKVAGKQLYSDQMPVGIELLGTSKIMLALETRLDKSGKYRITLSYSSDNWKTPLSADETGPSEKITNAWTGAAPYLRQFVSGEIVCAYTRENDLAYRMIDPSGKIFSENEYKPFDNISSSYWGSIEPIGSHTMLGIGESFNKVTVTRVENTLTYGKLNLNHTVNAKKMTAEIDGDAKDWKDNDEAFFIGSVSQAQASVRSASDAENLYFLIERLDEHLSSDGDELSIYFASPKTQGYYRLTVGSEGVVKIDYNDTKKFTQLDKSKLECSVTVNGTADWDADKDVGYSAEIKIPLSELGGASSEISVCLALSNVDEGKKSERDELDGSDITDKASWLTVKYK